MRISVVMNHNFFEELAQQCDEAIVLEKELEGKLDE